MPCETTFICGIAGRVGGKRPAWHGTCLVAGPTKPPATVARTKTNALRMSGFPFLVDGWLNSGHRFYKSYKVST